MMRTILLTGAALMLTSVAFAAPQKGDKKAAEPKEVKCAVMTDHKVNVKDATAKKNYVDYKGNRYFFCCGGCPTAFKKEPTKYAKNDHIKTPKAGKKS